VEAERRRWTEILAQSRDRLITSGDISDDAPGPSDEILRSWRRSYDDGASASALKTPYDDNLNLATRLVKAAEPVIGRVHHDLQGSPLTLVLADSMGKVLLRRSGEPTLEAQLDRALLAPGFNYAEKFVGTNGIGTALEGRAPALVRGAEHFNEHLQVFACVGVPLRDPVTRRQLGVLDITTWADRAQPALTALVRQAASSIEEGLLELASRGSRALLDEYLVTSRSREDVTIAVSAEAFIGNVAAVRRLGGIGRDELWPLVADALAGRDQAEIPLLTGTEDSLLLRLRAVRSPSGALVGGLVEFVEHDARQSRPRTPAAEVTEAVAPFAGLSPITIGPSVMVARMASATMPVCLVGEPGTGKRTLVETVAARRFPGRLLTVVDATSVAADTVAADTVPADTVSANTVSANTVADAVEKGLVDGHPVLVRAADALPAGVVTDVVARHSALGASAGWLTFTVRLPQTAGSGERPAEEELAAVGIPMVAVPALRSRIQDLRALLPAMVSAISHGQVTGVSPELVTRLLREPWDGNLTEVAHLLQDMVTRATGPVLDVAQLPAEFGSGVRRQLTPLEWMTREAIVEALRACGGDKAIAAESLGISRASIYRKIKSYGI